MSANRFFTVARRRIRGAGCIYLLSLSLGLSVSGQLRPAAATSPALDSPLLYIGNGRNRAANRETFAVGSGTADGYRYAPGASKRWGTNKLAGVEADVDAGYGPVDSFYSSFSDPLSDPNATNYTAGGNLANEAMAAHGDSGGAVFYERGAFWELAGITYGIEELQGKTNIEPGSPALFGEATYSADIAAYHSQIVAVTAVPEPSTLTLMALGVAGLLGRRRKSKLK